MTTATEIRDPYATWQADKATMFSDGRVDTLIVPLVEYLRSIGLTTYGSCQGHPREECRNASCTEHGSCLHPGQLVVDAVNLDPITAMRVEGEWFTQIACVTWPRFVWTFRWRWTRREDAIDALFGLRSSMPSSATELK